MSDDVFCARVWMHPVLLRGCVFRPLVWNQRCRLWRIFCLFVKICWFFSIYTRSKTIIWLVRFGNGMRTASISANTQRWWTGAAARLTWRARFKKCISLRASLIWKAYGSVALLYCGGAIFYTFFFFGQCDGVEKKIR